MNTRTAVTCTMVNSISAYLEKSLPPAEAAAFDRHIKTCSICANEIKEQNQMLSLVAQAYSNKKISSNFDKSADQKLRSLRQKRRQPVGDDVEEKDVFLAEQAVSGAGMGTMLANMGGAPWWGVSVALHVLVILLAGLISMSLTLPTADDAIVVITELQPPAQIQQVETEKPKNDNRAVLESKHDTPPTDPMSSDPSDIVVPPEILAMAELGDHFETINLDRPDTHSAFGNPDSHFFYSIKGNDEPEGGGGMGGCSLDNLIGVGGAASPGSGGGWGGGHGTGIGVGTGSGKGSFGSRHGGGRKLMIKRHGGSLATENAVDTALRWLARHQEADGHWDVKKYEGSEVVDAGITGLALLAFLGAGHSEKIGKYKNNVTRAIAWIISQQEADGSIGKNYKETPWHKGYAYHHALCGLALAEAAGMGRVPTTVEAAQKAVDYSTEVHQSGSGSDKYAWRYIAKEGADASVSGWFVMQLKSAKIAGLTVNPASFEGALRFYDSIEDKQELNGYVGGRFPYKKKGGTLALNTSAIGILCNLFLGRKPSDLMGGAEYLAQNLPAWDKTLGKSGVNDSCFPMYYTYYGTLSMFQLGTDYWKKWNEAMKAMLIPNQCKDGDKAGSWDLLGGADDLMGGRVYMTAVGALCLEVYYRYLKLTPDVGKKGSSK
ncbi:MAG: zf-HC2 domain-containing protein [Planctomycetota bacterium]